MDKLIVQIVSYSLTKTKLFPSNSYVTSKNTNKTEKSDSYDDLEVILSAASGPVVPVSKNLGNEITSEH